MRSILRTARAHVDSLRHAVAAPGPGEIERRLPGLAEAGVSLSCLQRRLSDEPAEPGLSQDLQAFRSELRMVRRLIQHGAAFPQGWASLLGSASGGYTAGGEGSSLTASGTGSVTG